MKITGRDRALLSLPFGLAKLQALFLQFAPGPLKLDAGSGGAAAVGQRGIGSGEVKKAVGLTLEGPRYHAGFDGSDRAAVSLAVPLHWTVSAEKGAGKILGPSSRPSEARGRHP